MRSFVVRKCCLLQRCGRCGEQAYQDKKVKVEGCRKNTKLTQISQPSFLSPAALVLHTPASHLSYNSTPCIFDCTSYQVSHFVMFRNQILTLHDKRLLLLLIYKLVNKKEEKVHSLSVKAAACHFECLFISAGQEGVLLLTRWSIYKIPWLCLKHRAVIITFVANKAFIV